MIDTKALREKILDLAMRGKLVEQDPTDEPASELLKRVREEKEQLIKEKKIKKEKALPEITEEEKPYDIPDSWEWVRLISITNYVQRGKSPKYSDVIKYPVISQKCVQWNGFDISKARFIDPLTIDKYEEIRMIKSNDILWNSTGTGTVGRVAIVREKDIITFDKVVADSHVTVVRVNENILAKYLFLYLSSNIVQDNLDSMVSGTTKQKELSLNAVISLNVPLPPLKEQERIVAKIEELFSFIDVIEQESADYDALAKQLDSKILDLAMKGKLVPQDPTDEPANELLKRIREEKERLIKEKKIKKERALPEIIEEEKPYDIPDNWEWVRLSDIQDVRDGTHDTPSYVDKGVPLITSKNLINGNLCFKNVKYISFEDADDIDKRSKVDSGDILFAMIGTIGNPVIVETHGQRISIKNVALLKQFSKEFSGEFVFQFLQSQQDFMRKNASGGLQKFYSLTMIRKMVAPCPPLEEQKRIVSKIKKIRSYL